LKGVKEMFKRNEGKLDRLIRLVLGLVLLPVGLFRLDGLRHSVLGLVIASLGGFGLFSSFTGFCPLYLPFGISTLEKEKELIAKCSSLADGCRCGTPSTGQTSRPDPPQILLNIHKSGFSK